MKMKARSGNKTEDFCTGAMGAICELMFASGVSKHSATSKLQEALDQGYRDDRSSNLGASTISQLADVCTRWHFEPKFLDANGQPRALRWNGKSGNLLQLARLVVGARRAREVANALVGKRLLRKLPNGTWLPKSRVVAPAGFEDAQVSRTSAMIERLLRTVAYNSSRRYKGEVLLEVMAQVPRLPNRELKAFKTFAKAQGLLFAKSVDDWLEARTLRGGKKSKIKATGAGVVAFAFVESLDEANGRLDH